MAATWRVRAIIASFVCSVQFYVRIWFLGGKFRHGKSRNEVNVVDGGLVSFVCSLILFLFLFSKNQVPLYWDDWINVLAWASPILLVDELLKAIGRFLNRKETTGSKTNSSMSLS